MFDKIFKVIFILSLLTIAYALYLNANNNRYRLVNEGLVISDSFSYYYVFDSNTGQAIKKSKKP